MRESRTSGSVREEPRKGLSLLDITKNGYGDLVVIRMKTYEERLAKLELYEQLAISEDQDEEGRRTQKRKS
jgi:PHD/YefM family antitoxin component YafN of YafNO toxin-antitoxin module